jgi:hypothetical protein
MALDGQQTKVAKQLLERLQKCDDGTNIVSAQNFQNCLHSLGLKFGTPMVDKLMLLCCVTENGSVDISRFVEVMAISEGTVVNDEFGLASPRVQSDLRKLGQSERVKRLAKDIHAIFYKFDSGNGSLDEFRMNLQKLGIQETNETKRLLRQTPISFRELLHSLTMTQTTPKRNTAGLGRNINIVGSSLNLAGHFDQNHFSRRGRGTHDFAEHAMHDSDVITWSKKEPKNNKGRASHKKHGKFFHDSSESHFAIRMDGEALPVLYSSDVAEMMRETDDHHFETTTQIFSASALKDKGLPITSAGYHTKDKGLIREQIYSCVRQLDQGKLTSKTFRKRLQALGVEMPPEAQRLLSMYEYNGSVDFNKFVRSFENYLNTATIHAPIAQVHGKRPQTAPVMHKGHAYHPVASTNHGDIISWQAGAKTDEAQPRHHSKLAFERKLKMMQDTDGRNILEWKNQKGPVEKVRRSRAPGSPHLSKHNDIITWEGSAAAAAAPRSKGVSVIGQKMQSKNCPFGTVADDRVDVSGIRQVTGHRKAAVGPRRCPTGQWFAPAPESMPIHHKRFLRHTNLVDHIGVGCTVNAAAPHHGKKQFEREEQLVDHLRGTAAAASGQNEQQYHHQKKLFAGEYARDNVQIAGGY